VAYRAGELPKRGANGVLADIHKQASLQGEMLLIHKVQSCIQ
jgi:hypothetical protein